MKQKKCRNCQCKFDPKNSLQVVCGMKCAIEYNKTKKQKQALKLKEFEQNDKEEKKLKASLINTRIQVHEYIRLRDKGKPCISCNTQWKSDFEAGHHYSANSFLTLKFDIDNIHGQCVFCNQYKDSNFANYALNLPNRIGIEKYNELVRKASIDKQFTKVWNLENLKEIREQIKILKKRLQN